MSDKIKSTLLLVMILGGFSAIVIGLLMQLGIAITISISGAIAFLFGLIFMFKEKE